MSSQIHTRCPNCGNTLPKLLDYSGSPFRICPFCSQEFFDQAIHEPAFYDPPKPTWNWLHFLGPGLIIMYVLWIIVSIYLIHLNGSRAVWLLVFPYPILVGAIPAFFIFRKEHKQYKAAKAKYNSSVTRLQDKDYVIRLLDHGYRIPKTFLSAHYPELVNYTPPSH